VNVHDPVRKSIDQTRRNHPEKSGQDYKGYTVFIQQIPDPGGMIKSFPVENIRWDGQMGGPLNDIGFRIVCQNKRDFDPGMMMEKFRNGLCVGSVTGGENGDVLHGVPGAFSGKCRESHSNLHEMIAWLTDS
jgi:hypothetical protein